MTDKQYPDDEAKDEVESLLRRALPTKYQRQMGSTWLAWKPDIPGHIGAGRTRSIALESLLRKLDLHFRIKTQYDRLIDAVLDEPAFDSHAPQASLLGAVFHKMVQDMGLVIGAAVV